MRTTRTFLSLVIPTRNEAENVERLISSICRAIPGPEKELVFVDDSDDDTPGVLQRLLSQADCPGLVLQRANAHREGGLSTAVCRGFATSSGAYICTMDADLQHPASAIPMLIEGARTTGADIVVGSRYSRIGEGGTQGFDGAGRQLVSISARVLARLALPSARATSDPLSGFFLLRRRVVEGIDLRPVGYKILLEILVRGRWQRVVDVPYAFHSRNAGVSKATAREGLQFARHLSLLFGQAWARQARHEVAPNTPLAAGPAAGTTEPRPARRLGYAGERQVNGNGRNGHNSSARKATLADEAPPAWMRKSALRTGASAGRTAEEEEAHAR